MDFLLGATCWHIVGHLNGDVWEWKLLCGARHGEYHIGGSAVDVVRSEMHVCRTCDRAASGEASKFVAEVAANLVGATSVSFDLFGPKSSSD